MRLIPRVRRRLRRPQFSLKAVLALTAIVSVPFGLWAEREHQYRVRLAAVTTLDESPLETRLNVRIAAPNADPDTSEWFDPKLRPLERDDVIVYVECGASEQAVSAILRLPKLKALALYDTSEACTEAYISAKVRPEAIGALAFMLVKVRTGAIDPALQRIAQHPALEEISLSGSSVSDAGVRHLTNLRSLRVVSLAYTEISDAALRAVASMMRLEELDLSRTAVTDEGMRHLERLVSLKRLYLTQTRISAEGLKHLARLPRLVELDLGSARIKDEDVKAIAQSTSLERLGLDGCNISDDALVYLARMRSLKVVGLSNTDVSSDGEAELLARKPGLDLGYLSGS